MNDIWRHAAVAPLLLLAAGAVAGGLDDTGQTLCYDAAGTAISCAKAADDGRYGRDAAAVAGVLAKTGAGRGGFDFTKIANDGRVLPASAELGSGPGDWACTRDNVTGLVWEVKTASGLRAAGHNYTWRSEDGGANGGNAGDAGADTCGGTLAAFANQCNSANYAAAVNAAALCGYADWRLPRIVELESVVDFSVPDTGGKPTIDTGYFPNTRILSYWSATNYAADPARAWVVYFFNGYSNTLVKSATFPVRLVRGGQ